MKLHPNLERQLLWIAGRIDDVFETMSDLIHKYHLVDARDPANDYKDGYCDVRDMFLYTNFALLRRFIEQERALETIVWEGELGKVRLAVEELYKWWTEERPKRYLAGERCLTQVEEIEDQRNLVRLINLRPYLWV